jgi:hypothetical protein
MRAWSWVGVVAFVVFGSSASAEDPTVPPGYESLPPSATTPPPSGYVTPYPVYPVQPVYTAPPGYVLVPAPTPGQPPEPPEPEGVSREGFALELGGGLAFVSFLDPGLSRFGMSPVDFSIGGYVSPRVAMFAHMQGIGLFGNEGDSVNAGGFAHLSFLTEVWITDQLGVGALLGIGAGGASGGPSPDQNGFVAGGRVMFDLAQSRHHSLTAVYQIVGAWTYPAVAMSLGLQWQYH